MIVIQLTMWSHISFKCFKCICIAVQYFKLRKINIDESELWSWLHSFTTCVSCSTSWVYDMYGTALEKISFLSGVTVIHFNSSFSWSSKEDFVTVYSVQSQNCSIENCNITFYPSSSVEEERNPCLKEHSNIGFFFLKDYNDEWNDLTKKFSSFVDDAASTLASSIKYVETGGSSSEHGGPRDGDPSRHTTSLTRKRRLAGGLVVSDMLLGDGAPVKPGRRISLHYTGSL